jgi:hypothetical protein
MNYFEKANNKINKYQYLLNFFGIFIALIGLYLTLIQLTQHFSDVKRDLYKFHGEQYPTIEFETIDTKNWLLRVNRIMQSDMLFQYANIYYHPYFDKKLLNIPIRIHDRILYLTPLLSYMELGFNNDSLLIVNKIESYAICRTPVILEINYIKYGESRIVRALYNIEFVISKNYKTVKSTKYDKFDFKLQGAYLLRFLEKNDSIKKELEVFENVKIIGGA